MGRLAWSKYGGVLESDEGRRRESGELGYLYGTYELSIKDPKGGAPVHDTGKLVEIWKKQADGNWKCIVDTYNSDLPVPVPDKK